MKSIKTRIITLAALVLTSWIPQSSHAANVLFTFQQTTSTGMDLFTTGGLSGLITNSTSPSVFFSLGYVSSGYNFSGKSRQDLLSSITYLATSSSSWSNVGTAQATGGKVNVSFNNGGSGFDTTALGINGNKLVAVVSQGINPLSQGIIDTTPIAIVRGNTGWDSILASDATPNPYTMSLSLVDFNILVGTYNANVGNVNSSGTVKFDTITLDAVPEPSTGALMMIGAVGLIALRRLRKD